MQSMSQISAVAILFQAARLLQTNPINIMVMMMVVMVMIMMMMMRRRRRMRRGGVG